MKSLTLLALKRQKETETTYHLAMAMIESHEFNIYDLLRSCVCCGCLILNMVFQVFVMFERLTHANIYLIIVVYTHEHAVWVSAL